MKCTCPFYSQTPTQHDASTAVSLSPHINNCFQSQNTAKHTTCLKNEGLTLCGGIDLNIYHQKTFMLQEISLMFILTNKVNQKFFQSDHFFRSEPASSQFESDVIKRMEQKISVIIKEKRLKYQSTKSKSTSATLRRVYCCKAQRFLS